MEARSTPNGVMIQLQKAYETKNLNLFVDLFGNESTRENFRFFVRKQLIEELYRLNESAQEIVITNVPFIDSGAVYKHIPFSKELEVHRSLFKSDKIIFSRPLNIGSTEYSIRLNDLGTLDTFQIAIKTDDNIISITSDIFDSLNGKEDFIIGPQVFILEKDPQNTSLWIITKWFEL